MTPSPLKKRASGDDPLALPKRKGQGRASGDNPLAIPKRKGPEVTTPGKGQGARR